MNKNLVYRIIHKFLYLITRRIVKDKIVALITPILWMLSDVGLAMTSYFDKASAIQ